MASQVLSCAYSGGASQSPRKHPEDFRGGQRRRKSAHKTRKTDISDTLNGMEAQAAKEDTVAAERHKNILVVAEQELSAKKLEHDDHLAMANRNFDPFTSCNAGLQNLLAIIAKCNSR